MLAAMRVAILALAAGCGGSASAPDAPGAEAAPLDAFALVAGRMRADDMRDDAQHLPVAGDAAFTSASAQLRQPDGTWAAVDIASDGSFSFAMPDARHYRLALSADG